jgi:hypothetical protein
LCRFQFFKMAHAFSRISGLAGTPTRNGS